MITVWLGLTSPQPAFASINIDFLSIPKKVKQISPNKAIFTNIDLSSISKKATQILPDKQFIGRNAKRFLSLGPAIVCQAYSDDLLNIDRATLKAIGEGVNSTTIISGAIASASAAGAGNLAGYAGMASAVSQLGLGGATTAIAGMMGSGATGAAATAVVTSAIGGPVVMGAVIVGGTSLATYGTYELGKFAIKNMENKLNLGKRAKHYCLR